MSDERIYCNAIYVKSHEGKYGEFLSVSIRATELGTFLIEHEDEKGWVRLNINKRKTPDKHGNTHYATLDTFVPRKREQTDDNLPI